MKQIKCRVLVRKSGAVVGVTSKELGYYPDDASYSVELTGTLPEPGRWVKGEPPQADEWWRWVIEDELGHTLGFAAIRYWDGRTTWLYNKSGFGGRCSGHYAPYYWTGDDRPVEPPPAEPERTCEIRWHEDGYWLLLTEQFDSNWNELPEALEAARKHGYRVTNEPREVVLKEGGAGRWWIESADGFHEHHASREEARAECAKRGWRILREEADERNCETCRHEMEPWNGGQCASCWPRGINWKPKPAERTSVTAVQNEDGRWTFTEFGRQRWTDVVSKAPMSEQEMRRECKRKGWILLNAVPLSEPAEKSIRHFTPNDMPTIVELDEAVRALDGVDAQSRETLLVATGELVRLRSEVARLRKEAKGAQSEPAPKGGVATCMDRGTPTTEDTCEVKWNGTHWVAATRRISWGQWGSLPEALAALDRAGFRVTNRAAALEGEKILKAEQRPTLGEMVDGFIERGKRGRRGLDELEVLLLRIVEAIGRDRR